MENNEKNKKKTVEKKKTAGKSKTTSTSQKKSIIMEEKSVMEKKTSIKKEKKKTFDSTFILKIIFGCLCVFVVVLGIMVFMKGQEAKNKVHANMTIPVYEEGLKSSVNINAYNLTQSREYILKITNYKDDIVADKDLTYTLTIQNRTDCTIKVTKGNDSSDLIVDQENTVIQDTLSKGDKQDVYYHVFVTSSGKLGVKDLFSIVVTS